MSLISSQPVFTAVATEVALVQQIDLNSSRMGSRLQECREAAGFTPEEFVAQVNHLIRRTEEISEPAARLLRAYQRQSDINPISTMADLTVKNLLIYETNERRIPKRYISEMADILDNSNVGYIVYGVGSGPKPHNAPAIETA